MQQTGTIHEGDGKTIYVRPEAEEGVGDICGYFLDECAGRADLNDGAGERGAGERVEVGVADGVAHITRRN